jgi:capsular polysaccharide biosynthesis protein
MVLLHFYGFAPGEADKRLGNIVRSPDPSRPAVHKVRDAIALTAVSGLHDTEGRLIEEAAVRTVSRDAPPVRKEKLYKGAPGVVTVPDRLRVVDEPVLFGGHLMKHYGHFIIESMSRLWARDLFPNLPIVFTCPRKWRDPPAYGTDVLNALDLQQRTILVDEPTLFREVVCPWTAIEYRWKAFAVADEPHTAVARALDRSSRRIWHRPVYLTRSGLSDRLRRSEAEPELEAELSSRNFEIIRPEELSLAEQISIFEQAPLIVGTVGSALHTALFSRSRPTLATLNWGRGFEHYLLVDGVKRHSSYYLKSMMRHSDGEEYDIDVPLTLSLLEQAGLVESPVKVSSR